MFSNEELEYLKKLLREKREVLRENWNESDEDEMNITEEILATLINMAEESI